MTKRYSPQDIDAQDNERLDIEMKKRQIQYKSLTPVLFGEHTIKASTPIYATPDYLPPQKRTGRRRPSGRGKIAKRRTLSQLDGDE